MAEPYEGYCEGMNSITGFVVASGRGLFRSGYVLNLQYNCNIVPVDIVANAVIAASMLRGKTKSNEALIYNAAESYEKKTSWDQLIQIGIKTHAKYPYNYSLGIPGGNVTKYQFIHRIKTIILMVLPALFFDVILRVKGMKPV